MLCKVLTPFTTLGCGMLHVCKMRLWERLADSISGVAGLIPKKKKKKKVGIKKGEKRTCTYFGMKQNELLSNTFHLIPINFSQ